MKEETGSEAVMRQVSSFGMGRVDSMGTVGIGLARADKMSRVAKIMKSEVGRGIMCSIMEGHQWWEIGGIGDEGWPMVARLAASRARCRHEGSFRMGCMGVHGNGVGDGYGHYGLMFGGLGWFWRLGLAELRDLESGSWEF